MKSSLPCASLREEVYQFINILWHNLKELCPTITTVVGSVEQRLSGMCHAYNTASNLLQKIYGVSVGQMVDINDTAQIAAEMIELGDPFGAEFQQKLQYAEVEEVPALVDILRMTVQQIVKATPSLDAKDVATRLSDQHDIMAASGRMDSFSQTAVALLQEAVRLRQENVSSMKYSHVISRAEQYVAENFCDPNISLINVAKYVGLSSAHFSTVFSQTVGRSFINYLTAMRIERAKELLSTTSMKLSTIAMEIGYNEPMRSSSVMRSS